MEWLDEHEYRKTPGWQRKSNWNVNCGCITHLCFGWWRKFPISGPIEFDFGLKFIDFLPCNSFILLPVLLFGLLNCEISCVPHSTDKLKSKFVWTVFHGRRWEMLSFNSYRNLVCVGVWKYTMTWIPSLDIYTQFHVKLTNSKGQGMELKWTNLISEHSMCVIFLRISTFERRLFWNSHWIAAVQVHSSNSFDMVSPKGKNIKHVCLFSTGVNVLSRCCRIN